MSYVPPGYRDRDEWLEDRRAAALAAMSWRQRFSRWWWINWPAVATLAALVMLLAVLFVVAW